MKVVFQLKESPARRFLRYALWVILLLGAIALVSSFARLTLQSLKEGAFKQDAAQLLFYAPEKALDISEKLYKASPSPKTFLSFIKTAAQTQNWFLADLLLENERNAQNFELRAYRAIVLARTSPVELPQAVLALGRDIPASDAQRLLLARVALVSRDGDLNIRARKALQDVQTDTLTAQARLLKAQLAFLNGEIDGASELAKELVGRNLTTAEAVELLELCEKINLPEGADYRSALKVRARENPLMALVLARYLTRKDSPETGALFLTSLPEAIRGHGEVALLQAELLYNSGNLPTLKTLLANFPDPALGPALASLVSGDPAVFFAALDAKQLFSFVRFARGTGFYAAENQALLLLNAQAPSLWSLYEATVAAEKMRDESAILEAWRALAKALPQNVLVAAQRAYWQLLANPEDKGTIEEAYQTLKAAAQKHPSRSEIAAVLALAHERLGNLTDALLALPASPATQREKLIGAVITAKANQFEKAKKLFAEIDEKKLTSAERALYNEAAQKLQANAPLQRLFDFIQTSQ